MQSRVKVQLDSFQEACREKGLRITPQRIEIFKELVKSNDHPTAEKLHQRLIEKMSTLSLDTVYRTLGTFSDLGLINKVETVESQAHFEVSHVPHHHLICEHCKKIIDFKWDQVDKADLPQEVQALGVFEKKNVIIYGTCNSCLKK
ncbi:MAG: transcriptional repressor [Deltaproteobacteria bacterium]|jgi:Fur family peroxide stress response transcriptional regulator|nr:transcriptional repressor [Deltaproteobacteria bacterium]MCW8893480.1 transcriptional repressor [Deltaproteobacteria bacterium]MCW9048961.1 transcriptional repressor [Deltaproteobacteria bacterium]